jgi:nucleoside 2-deoxyribosyltransferase
MSDLVYLAGPMTGLTYNEADDWRTEASAELSASGIRSVSPMRGKQNMIQGKIENFYPGEALGTPTAIITRDLFDVQSADVVLVNLLNSQSVSIGTVAEMAWCYLLHKPIVVIVEKDSIYAKHPFTLAMSRFVARDLRQGLQIVIGILGG